MWRGFKSFRTVWEASISFGPIYLVGASQHTRCNQQIFHILGLDEMSYWIFGIQRDRIRSITFTSSRALDDPNNLLLSRVDDGADGKWEGIMICIRVMHTIQAVIHQISDQAGNRIVSVTAVNPGVGAYLRSFGQLEVRDSPLEAVIGE